MPGTPYGMREKTSVFPLRCICDNDPVEARYTLRWIWIGPGIHGRRSLSVTINQFPCPGNKIGASFDTEWDNCAIAAAFPIQRDRSVDGPDLRSAGIEELLASPGIFFPTILDLLFLGIGQPLTLGFGVRVFRQL